MFALRQKRASVVLIDHRFGGSGLGIYSREDAKSCNAISAKQFFDATQIRQKRLTTAICWSGTGFLWHRFWAHCELQRVPKYSFRWDEFALKKS
jgi:hypothetical protein